MSNHLNLYREKHSGAKRIPDIAMNIFYSRVEAPSPEEGFDAIITTMPQLEFGSADDKALFLEWV